MRATREQALAAVSRERDYQNVRWVNHEHEAESYVLFIEHYAHLARTKATTLDFAVPENLDAYLADLRKIAALAVAALEQHGAPTR